MLENHLEQINPFLARLIQEGKLSSIRTLSANSPALMALAAIPPAVPFHSIIGQKIPGPLHTGSDGVVSYASSHLAGAESEKIIPFGHEAFLHPDAVSEIKRVFTRISNPCSRNRRVVGRLHKFFDLAGVKLSLHTA